MIDCSRRKYFRKADLGAGYNVLKVTILIKTPAMNRDLFRAQVFRSSLFKKKETNLKPGFEPMIYCLDAPATNLKKKTLHR